MTDLGEVRYYLAIEIKRDRKERTITLNQTTYFKKVLDRFGMKDCHGASKPMDSTVPNYVMAAEQGY